MIKIILLMKIKFVIYTQTTSKVGTLTRSRPEFEPGEVDAEGTQLE